MTNQTPSPQSVVVPVDEAAARVRAFLARHAKSKQNDQVSIHGYDIGAPSEVELLVSDLALLAAAPAPSSLAGGEVDPQIIARLQAEADEPGIADSCMVFGPDLRAILKRLAALSPEAPARVGVAMRPMADAPRDGRKIIVFRKEDPRLVWRDDTRTKFAPDEPRGWVGTNGFPVEVVEASWRGWIPVPGEALTPRHEAPAEGAGEREAIAEIITGFPADYYDCETTGPSAKGDWKEALRLADKIIALRARSSAPEAREGEAAPWGHAVKFGANGWDFADDEDPDALDKLRADPEYQVLPLFTHPAAPSADKLREFGRHTNLELSFSHAVDDECWCVHVVRGNINDREWFCIGKGATPSEAIDQALAALKAEG